MKDEIKEILESLDKISKAEYYPEDLLTYKECHLLLDYITNLQQIEQDHQKLNGELREEIEDYKSRNEKAVEYIKECIDSEDIYEQFLSTSETKEVLNILKGGDEDVKD